MSLFHFERSKQAGLPENKQKRSTVQVFCWQQTRHSPPRLANSCSGPLTICSPLPSSLSWGSCASPLLHPKPVLLLHFPINSRPSSHVPVELLIPAPHVYRTAWQIRWVKWWVLEINMLKQLCEVAPLPPPQENHPCYSKPWCHNTRSRFSALEPLTKAEPLNRDFWIGQDFHTMRLIQVCHFKKSHRLETIPTILKPSKMSPPLLSSFFLVLPF